MLSDKRLNITRAPKKVKSPAQQLLAHLRAISDSHGHFSLDADTIAQRLGVSRKTVYRALEGLKRQGLVSLVQLHRGRGRHSVYQLRVEQKSKPHEIDEKTVNKKCVTLESKNKKIYIKHSKDPKGLVGEQSLRERGVKRESSDYQGLEAAKVVLVVGARFYRQAMRETRLGLEHWDLPEPIRHALEGFIGLRLDGASLAYARQLVSQIWALRREIEALARSGASPKRVCSFIAGRLAGKPDRSRREVLRRTAELIRSSLDSDLITRRIQGLRRFESERETEYLSGQVCKRCGYRHTRIEYETGYRDDGTGQLSCFGWARVKLDELHETRKLAARRQREEQCRQCGGSLRGGHVEGLCWGCFEKLSAYHQAANFLQTSHFAACPPWELRNPDFKSATLSQKARGMAELGAAASQSHAEPFDVAQASLIVPGASTTHPPKGDKAIRTCFNTSLV